MAKNLKSNAPGTFSEQDILIHAKKEQETAEKEMTGILKDASTLNNEFIEQLYKDQKRATISVDSINGPVFSLEHALELAAPFTTIYLCEGVYTCKNPITKPGIIIDKKDKVKDVFIIGGKGPVIDVQLEENHFVVIKKIVLMHTGVNLGFKFKEAAPGKPKYSQNMNTQTLREFEI
jgi:hypothetical protein